MTRPLDPLTPHQSLLLRAVTQPAPRAVAAWEAWRADTAVDDLDPDSQWLLPLLSVQLHVAGVLATATQRYTDVYRHNWYKNHLRLRAFGHDGVLIGGAAFAVAYAPAIGARPFRRLLWHSGQPPLRTIEVSVASRTVRVPDAVDALVHACAGVGAAHDPSSLLWVVDASQAGACLDVSGWASVRERAAELGLGATVGEGLDWLHAEGLHPQERAAA